MNLLITIETDLKIVPDETLRALRNEDYRQLIQYARERLARQLETAGATKQTVLEAGKSLDLEALTMGFARRFATHKRPNLLLHDPGRLARLLRNTDRPVQLIIAGKALVQAWSDLMKIEPWMPRVETRGSLLSFSYAIPFYTKNHNIMRLLFYSHTRQIPLYFQVGKEASYHNTCS